MKPAKRDADPHARSHAGRHGDFAIEWFSGGCSGCYTAGWYVYAAGGDTGPFHTSQAAFGAVKDAIDSTLRSS